MSLLGEWPALEEGVPSLEVEPSDSVRFIGPVLQEDVTASIWLRNRHPLFAMLFKLKCTDNGKFRIHECAGFLARDTSKRLAVTRYKAEQADSIKTHRDKLLLQFLAVGDERLLSLEPREAWSRATKSNAQVKNYKLTVRYDAAYG